MPWEKAKGTGRPTGLWLSSIDYKGPVKPELSKPHQHEFGLGYDMVYKGLVDGKEKTIARLDGLRPDEAMFLKKKWGL